VDSVVLRPVSWERPYDSQYEALGRELIERGFEVEIVVPAPYEERGTELYHLMFLMATPDLVIHVAEHVADHAIDIIETAVLANLIGKIKIGPKHGMRRKVVIVGPRGEPLREVYVPVGEDDDEEDQED
jgi:hypothetical protein